MSRSRKKDKTSKWQGKWRERISAPDSQSDGALSIRPFPSFPERSSLRLWWHDILRHHGRYSCYAIFLLLPSDKAAMHYLTNFGRELHLISGNSCLVIALSEARSKRFDFDDKVWDVAVREQVSEGYSIRIAQLFGIDLLKFPCLVVFEDIRSSKHVVVTLKDMSVAEIADKMREVFSVIQEAITTKVNPLEMLEAHRNNLSFRKAGQTIVSELRSLAGKTFETAIEAWIKASLT